MNPRQMEMMMKRLGISNEPLEGVTEVIIRLANEERVFRKPRSRSTIRASPATRSSRGGSSLVAENIQLLCARHNLAKHDKIE